MGSWTQGPPSCGHTGKYLFIYVDTMKCALSVCLLLLATAAEHKTDAAPKVAAAKKDAKGYDYDYYNYNPYMYQKRGSICLPFGMSCSVKGIPCCGDGVECKCNLFSSNCKCQRASLFGRR